MVVMFRTLGFVGPCVVVVGMDFESVGLLGGVDGFVCRRGPERGVDSGADFKR